MNRAVLSVLLAIMPALCLGAEDPKSPSAGTGLAFTPQAGAPTAMQMMGVLEFTDGKYFLTDATSKTSVELRGADLVRFKGKSVQIVGSVIFGAPATGGASQVIQVAKIELTSQSSKLTGLAGGAGAGSGAAPTAGRVTVATSGRTQPPPTQQTAPGAQAGAGAVTPPQTTAPPAAPPAAATDAGKPAEAAPSPDANVSVTVPVDANTFVIGPEDELDIKVWEQPQLSGAVRVRSDGMITVPLLKNEIRAAGLTLLALRQAITEELGANALKDPQITVNLLAAHSKKYYLYGQVKTPGEKELIMPTTVLHAIVSAGGFLDFANQKDIAVARGEKRFKFNFKEVMAGKNLKQDIYLESGDIIYVK